MRAVISLAPFLVCAVSLDAQIVTTLNRLSNGSSEIRIRNTSSLSLTAFVISAAVVGTNHADGETADNHAPYVAYYDPAIDSTMEPILSNQERTLPPVAVMCATPQRSLAAVLRHEEEKNLPSLTWAGRTASFCYLEQPITAGILADGSTTGDAGLLGRLMLRRSNMLLAVETALETLADAGGRNVPRDRLIEQFRKMADSMRRWYLPPEQQVGSGVYQSIVGKLMNLPEQQLGAPFPPTDFVARETGMLNRQRVILLGSKPSLADTFNGSLSRN